MRRAIFAALVPMLLAGCTASVTVPREAEPSASASVSSSPSTHRSVSPSPPPEVYEIGEEVDALPAASFRVKSIEEAAELKIKWKDSIKASEGKRMWLAKIAYTPRIADPGRSDGAGTTLDCIGMDLIQSNMFTDEGKRMEKVPEGAFVNGPPCKGPVMPGDTAEYWVAFQGDNHEFGSLRMWDGSPSDEDRLWVFVVRDVDVKLPPPSND